MSLTVPGGLAPTPPRCASLRGMLTLLMIAVPWSMLIMSWGHDDTQASKPLHHHHHHQLISSSAMPCQVQSTADSAADDDDDDADDAEADDDKYRKGLELLFRKMKYRIADDDGDNGADDDDDGINGPRRERPRSGPARPYPPLRSPQRWVPGLPVIFVVTPTYARSVQKAELTRLSQSLALVPNLHWVLVEDAERPGGLVGALLAGAGGPGGRAGVAYTHLHAHTPTHFRIMANRSHIKYPRGTLQRNAGIKWLRDTYGRSENASSSASSTSSASSSATSSASSSVTSSAPDGVVYFADDDNTYSLEVFEEMRWTRSVSVWPVAFVGGLRFEAPIVGTDGRVRGWRTVFDPRRPFAIDMAGFAVNLRLLLDKPKAYFKLQGVKGGYQETSLLQQLVTREELEPKADNCTRVLVWHTRTERPSFIYEGKRGFTDPSVEV